MGKSDTIDDAEFEIHDLKYTRAVLSVCQARNFRSRFSLSRRLDLPYYYAVWRRV